MSNLPPTDPIVEKLRAAWLKLDPPLDLCVAGMNVLDKIISEFTIMAAGGNGGPDIAQQVRRVSRAASLAELDRLGKACAAAAAVARMHLPAFVAVADANILRPRLLGFADDADAIAAAAARAKPLLPADAAASPHAQPNGRPKKVRAQLVAGLALAGYAELFPAAARAERLPTLVGELFEILNISASATKAIAAAKTARRREAARQAKVAHAS